MAGQKTSIPAVPLRTPFKDPDGNLTRPWILFFEKLGSTNSRPFTRTLLVKDSTTGNGIADVVTVYAPGAATRITGVLRLAITADLTVRVNLNGFALVTITIPAATAIDTVVTETTFTPANAPLADGDVLTWDITASDGSKDADGVASFTLIWS